jgi:AcrR family transcriptional regulator
LLPPEDLIQRNVTMLRYCVKVGRPRQHDERTAEALLRSAELIVEADGLERLSLRRIADDVGTTTRAVYSVFGSKDGLVTALGARAFDVLDAGLAAMRPTGDPVTDLVEAGVTVFRRFAIEHPSLFGIGVQRTSTSAGQFARFRPSAQRALARLDAIVARVPGSGGLAPGRLVRLTTIEFHAMCEGLAAVELRCLLPEGEEENVWREALTALVTGFGTLPRGPVQARM